MEWLENLERLERELWASLPETVGVHVYRKAWKDFNAALRTDALRLMRIARAAQWADAEFHSWQNQAWPESHREAMSALRAAFEGKDDLRAEVRG
jgi:hypothetical protein